METFETYQRRAINLDSACEPAALVTTLPELRALEAEVSTSDLTDDERRSLTFTLSSVMINLGSDTSSVDDLSTGVQWATRLLNDDETPTVLVLQAAYNRANGLTEIFEIHEAGDCLTAIRSSRCSYRLAHLEGLREPRMLFSGIGADRSVPADVRGRALCNLGNVLDDSGRWVEAYSAYMDALEADPTNGNAAGNIAELLRRRLARRVDQRGHLAAVYDKYVAMAQALRERTIELAGTAVAERWDALKLIGGDGHLLHAGNGLDPYQDWIVRHRLALVASAEGLGSDSLQWDTACAQGVVGVAGDDVPGVFGALNVLKAEFLVARRLAFRGAEMHAESPGRQHPDDSGLYTDTLDGAIYGQAPAMLLLAQRSALDVLDKIAVTANEHFKSGLPPSKVEYRRQTTATTPSWPSLNSQGTSVRSACTQAPGCCVTRVLTDWCTRPAASRPGPPRTPSAPSTCTNFRPQRLKHCKWFEPPTCTLSTSSTASSASQATTPVSALYLTSNNHQDPRISTVELRSLKAVAPVQIRSGLRV
jgi:tetratricopeptide (TPR) repeat protein